MALVQIHKDTAAINAEVAKIEAKLPTLNAIRADLVSLGVTTPTLADIRTLHAMGNYLNETHLKPMSARGKSLTISGLTIDISFIVLDAALVASIKSKLNTLSRVVWDHYEIVGGAVVVVDDLEAQIEPGYITMGTDLAAEVIEDAEAVVTSLNAALAKIEVDNNAHPMRFLDNWFYWNPDTQRYAVDFISIGKHVTGELPEEEPGE